MTTSSKLPSYHEGLSELRSNLKNMLPTEALDVFDNDAEELQNSIQSILKVKEGGKAPDFTLLNASGKQIKLYELLKDSRIVLTFYRGNWCPYCNLQLNQYQQSLDKFIKSGAKLVAISPQTPDHSLSMKEKNELEFEVLSDPQNKVARHYTTVFAYGAEPVKTMGKLGYDFDSFYSDDSKEIPVPAVFIIERDGTISFARSLGGDYRNRVEVSEIINALNA